MTPLRSLFVIIAPGACILIVGILAYLMTSSRTDDISSITISEDSTGAPQDIAPEFFEQAYIPSITPEPPVPPEDLLPPTPIAEPPAPRPVVQNPKAFLIGNVRTGKVYFERNPNTPLPVASMSKLVTAFVATDMLKKDTLIEVTVETASTAPDRSNLQPGERFTLETMLYPLLLNSSNVAAESIASSTDRGEFMTEMRSYSWEVGMPKSYFADPSGLSARNVATARDMFGLAQYLYSYRPDILSLTRISTTSVATTTEHGAHLFVNTHPFVTDTRFIGGKTGRTPEAGETMLTIMNIDDHPIALIVIGSKYGHREADTRVLLEQIEERLGRDPKIDPP